MKLALRILGTIIGVALIAATSIKYYLDQTHLLATISGLFIGAIFIIYGIGGNKALSKVLPGTAKTKLW